jgi:uncharacterized membrane protein YgcG
MIATIAEKYLAKWMCVLAVFGLTGVELWAAEPNADAAPAPPVPRAAAADDGPKTAEQPAAPAQRQPKTTGKRARALRLQKDGSVIGTVTTIDPVSLELVPVPDAIVTFMQNTKVVAQAKSTTDGRFSASGLTPHAVYSLLIRSPRWICAVGIFTEPDEPAAAAAFIQEASTTRLISRRPQATAGHQFILASAEASADDSASGDPAFEGLQSIPYQDFVSGLQQGLFGDLGATGFPGAGGLGGGGAGGGGAGGGGAGGGGGGGVAAGAAMGAAGAALGAAAAGRRPASPFSP